MDVSQRFKRFKTNTIVKSVIIPLIIIISTALIFYISIPSIENELPSSSGLSEQTMQTEAVENG